MSVLDLKEIENFINIHGEKMIKSDQVVFSDIVERNKVLLLNASDYMTKILSELVKKGYKPLYVSFWKDSVNRKISLDGIEIYEVDSDKDIVIVLEEITNLYSDERYDFIILDNLFNDYLKMETNDERNLRNIMYSIKSLMDIYKLSNEKKTLFHFELSSDYLKKNLFLNSVLYLGLTDGNFVKIRDAFSPCGTQHKLF